MKLLKSLTLSLGLLAPVMASAYVLDSTTNVVTDTASGKEWLQWTETMGMSVTDDFSSFSGGGWDVATNADMASLFGDFFPSVAWDSDENTYQNNGGTPSFGDGTDDSYRFGELFGWTTYVDSISVTTGSNYTATVGLYSTRAWFGQDEDADSRFNVAGMQSEFLRSIGSGGFDEIPEYSVLANDFAFPSPIASFGVSLVRRIPAVEVPEPSTLALLGLGLCGLGYTRRKSRV